MSDGTHTKIWHTSNLFATSPAWDTGAQFDGIYNLIRPASTPGSVLAYKSSDTPTPVFDYDLTLTNAGLSQTDSNRNPFSTWGSGTGWPEVDDVDQNGFPRRELWQAGLTLSSVHLTRVVMTFDYQLGSYNANEPAYEIIVDGVSSAQVLRDDSHNGTDLTFTWFGSGTTSLVTFTLITDRADPGPHSFTGSATLKRITGYDETGDAEVIYSSDYGATVGSPITLGSTPGAVGGFDLQHNGTVSYAAALNSILKATTLGGSYSSDQSLSGVNAVMIEIPWYTRNSLTALNSGGSPQYIFGLDGPDGSGHTLYWVVSGSPVNITPVIGGNPGIATNANCLATWKGKYIAAVLGFGGALHLVTSIDGGSSWLDRGVVDGAYTRVRRQAATPGQLYMAGNVLDYSGTFGASVISKTKPDSDPLVFFEPFG